MSSDTPNKTYEFIDVAEDIEGRDVVTFLCKRCGNTSTSFVFSHSMGDYITCGLCNFRHNGGSHG